MSKHGTFLSYPVNQDGKTPILVTPDTPLPVDNYGYQVARGNVPGAIPVGAYGYRDAGAGEVNRVIWPNGVFTLPPTSGVQMSIVSTSANDDITGIFISGLSPIINRPLFTRITIHV